MKAPTAYRTPILIVAITALMVVPGPASASGTASSLSAVDSIAADVAKDGTLSSKPSTQTSASDSPTKDAYGTSSTDLVPPPVTCGSSSSSSSSTSDLSSKPATDTCVIEQCSSADIDGKDANGNPCTKPATETVTTTPTTPEAPCVETDNGFGSGNGTVCGGGSIPSEQLAVDQPVSGGGAPLPAPAEISGGGGAELPFTGLPLWYAIYGGVGLMLAGAALWLRGRVNDRRA